MSEELDLLAESEARWPGDPELAARFKALEFKAPLETILETDFFTTGASGMNGVDQRVVILACRHTAIAERGQWKKMRCQLCQAMIDRGADYDGYRSQFKK